MQSDDCFLIDASLGDLKQQGGLQLGFYCTSKK
jgi:hypothetical protein